MIAAQFADEMNTKQQKDLIKQHTDAAHESGDVDTHFAHYMRSIKSINPKADEAMHRKEFDGEVDRIGARKAQNKYKTMGSRVASGIAKMFGLGEELEGPVDAAVSRVMDTIGEMDKSKRRDVNSKQVALIVNATGRRLSHKHHDEFKEKVMKKIQELG
jgi:hypothetical protein